MHSWKTSIHHWRSRRQLSSASPGPTHGGMVLPRPIAAPNPRQCSGGRVDDSGVASAVGTTIAWCRPLERLLRCTGSLLDGLGDFGIGLGGLDSIGHLGFFCKHRFLKLWFQRCWMISMLSCIGFHTSQIHHHSFISWFCVPICFVCISSLSPFPNISGNGSDASSSFFFVDFMFICLCT
jgi:hypothetical protein